MRLTSTRRGGRRLRAGAGLESALGDVAGALVAFVKKGFLETVVVKKNDSYPGGPGL